MGRSISAQADDSSAAVDSSSSTGYKDQAGERRAYLVNHGSFNPVHRHHLEMMVKAKERLEQAGYEVVAGVLGIANASWIQRKGAKAMKDGHRVATIQLACDEENVSHWLRPDGRGVEVGNAWGLDDWYTRADMHSIWPESVGFVVMGADVMSYNWRKLKNGDNVVVVGRAGTDSAMEEEFQRWDGHGGFYYVETLPGLFSSTRVRQALETQDEQELRELCHAKVSDYLLGHSPDELFMPLPDNASSCKPSLPT